jgi:hypothetical protein
LRTALAGGPSLLHEPTAILPDSAGRQRIGHCGHQLHQIRGKLTVLSIEVAAG